MNDKTAKEFPIDPVDSGAKEKWLHEHLLNFLYNNAISSALGSLAVVCLLSWVIHNTSNTHYLIPWVFACFVVALLRGVLVNMYRYDKKSHEELFWLASFRLLNLCSGIIIGSAAWLYIPYADTGNTVLILCAIVGLVAGATPSYSVDFYSFISFVLPSCLLPITFYLTKMPDGYEAITGMFLLYIVVMIRVSAQSRESLMNNFELSFALNYRATHDSLSGLLNRQELENRFQILTPNARHGVAVLFLDLDNFKLLNDTLGHQIGDEAIVHVSEIIRKHVRYDDICARLGGDEFVALLYLDDPSVAEKIGRAIISDINKLDFDNPTFPGLGCSIGLAFKSNNAIRYEVIMKEADSSCYISKNSGKNQVTFRNII